MKGQLNKYISVEQSVNVLCELQHGWIHYITLIQYSFIF